MNTARKKELITIIIGAMLLAGAVIAEKLIPDLAWYWRLALYLAPYIVLGLEVIIKAVHGILGGELLDENFLMAAASIGAICIGERVEAVLVMLLYRIGELLQDIAVGRSRDAVSGLLDICPESVNLVTENGIKTAAPEEVHIGDVFIVRAGERIPLDGTVLEGSSGINTAALTGESIPQYASAGDRVKSGCININGVLRIRSECEYEDSTVARMMELIEGAAANKSQSEKFITRFARWYTPIVVILAVLLAVIPPLFFGGKWPDWIYRALNFLVISCPCALVISVPLAFFGGIGCASKRGILAKGSNCLETLAKCGTAVFDKTGTLTEGSFKIASIQPAEGFTRDSLLRFTAAAESLSTHPLALCITEACGTEYGGYDSISEYEEIAGKGVRASAEGHAIIAGNIGLMHMNNVEAGEPEEIGTAIHTAVDGKYAGYILIRDELKQDAMAACSKLKNDLGIRTVMLTGDRAAIGKSIAAELGIDEVHTELLPEDKVSHIEGIIAKQNGNKTTVFVGDGINDAPVIARADVGVAMGGLGSDAAIEAADIVLMDDHISKLPLAVRISKRTVSIAKQNIFFALAVKLIVLILGALGFTQMWMAIIADVGVCLAAVINAMRTLHIKE